MPTVNTYLNHRYCMYRYVQTQVLVINIILLGTREGTCYTINIHIPQSLSLYVTMRTDTSTCN